MFTEEMGLTSRGWSQKLKTSILKPTCSPLLMTSGYSTVTKNSRDESCWN